MNNAFVHVLGYRARDFPEKLEYGEGGEVKTANESGVAVRFKSEEQKIIWRRPCGAKFLISVVKRLVVESEL